MSNSDPPTGNEPNDSLPGERDVDLQQEIFSHKLDKYDYAIFRALNEDGRMSDTEIANRVGLSRSAVRRRRESMTESGVFDILAVMVLQEMELAYADVQIVIDNSAPREQRHQLINGLVDADLVYSLDSCMGEYDLFARAWHESLSELQDYLWDLLESLPAVDSYSVIPVVNTWKAWDKPLEKAGEE